LKISFLLSYSRDINIKNNNVHTNIELSLSLCHTHALFSGRITTGNNSEKKKEAMFCFCERHATRIKNTANKKKKGRRKESKLSRGIFTTSFPYVLMLIKH
jgi:hypothetical protein